MNVKQKICHTAHEGSDREKAVLTRRLWCWWDNYESKRFMLISSSRGDHAIIGRYISPEAAMQDYVETISDNHVAILDLYADVEVATFTNSKWEKVNHEYTEKRI